MAHKENGMAKITINMDSLKSSRDWVRHKVNEGPNIYRIMPPFGNPEQHNNYPYHRWSIAWLVDPKSNGRRPFATPLTEGEACPVQEYNDALNLFIEERKSQLKAEGYSDADSKTELEGLRTVQWGMRLQHVYAYNACNQAGSVGILELKSTAHKAMKKMMNQYIKEHGQDPTSLGSEEEDSGVWFNISKEGKGKETEYNVAFNQTRQKMNGTLVKIDDRSPLPEQVVANYDNLAYDLNSIYIRKDYNELKAILMFNLALIAKDTPEAAIPGYEVEDAAPVKKVVAPAPVAATKKPASKVMLNLDDEDEVVSAPVRKAQPTASRPTPVPTPSNGALVKKSVAATQEFDDDELNALTNEILGD
jgi:hypothetical protein